MAGFVDFISLALVITVFTGSIYGVIYVAGLFSAGVQSTKESLKKQGLHVSDNGVSIKTSKRFDRQDYIDATQRNIVKAMDASSFKHNGKPGPGASSIERTPSGRSSSSNEEEKKKKRNGLFGKRK